MENPARAENFAAQALADGHDIDKAVAAALRSYEAGHLTRLGPVERGRMVRAVGAYLTTNREAFERARETTRSTALTKSAAT